MLQVPNCRLCQRGEQSRRRPRKTDRPHAERCQAGTGLHRSLRSACSWCRLLRRKATGHRFQGRCAPIACLKKSMLEAGSETCTCRDRPTCSRWRKARWNLLRWRVFGARSGNNDNTGPRGRTVKAKPYQDAYQDEDCDRPESAHSSILDLNHS